MITSDKDYAAGFRDGEQSEQELRSAALRLVQLQKVARKTQNKNLRNQARSLIGQWLEIYSRKRWDQPEGKMITVEKMAQCIAHNWEVIVGLLTTELRRQMSESYRDLEIELNKEIIRDHDRVKLKNPRHFELLLEKIRVLSQRPYQIDSIKKYIRRSKPPHLVAGRPRRKT